jgi:hypothetical protein
MIGINGISTGSDISLPKKSARDLSGLQVPREEVTEKISLLQLDVPDFRWFHQ